MVTGARARTLELRQIRQEKAKAAFKAKSSYAAAAASARYDTVGRKKVYLDALGEGHTKVAARQLAAMENREGKLVPLTDQSVRKWRERDPVFAAKESELWGKFRSNADEPVKSYDGSFQSFRKVFFGYDTPKHQVKMVSVLDRALHSKTFSITLMLLPPAAGKTSTLEDWICYRLAKNPDLRIGIVSSTPSHGWKIIGKLKKRFTAEGSKFVMQFGPFYENGQEKQGKPWAQDHITIVQRDSDERDYSIVAFGWDGSMIGTRWDILIVDDIQPHKQLSQTEKIMANFRQDIITRVGSDCPIVIVGNRVGLGDVYEEMLDTPDFIDDLVTVPAIDDNGESFWPALWPLEVLNKRRQIVLEDTWWRNYMQNPKASGKGSFSEALIDSARDKMQGHFRPKEAVGVLIGTDPALGGGCATIAAAYTSDWLCFIDLDYSFKLPGVESIIEIGDEMAVRCRAGIWVIEQNAMQKGIVRDQRLDELASRHNYTIIPHQTGSLKTDPTWGVGTMSDSMRRGELRIAWASEYVQERMAPLCEQLIRWRPDVETRNLRQDTVMAAWFVHKYWKENRYHGVGSGQGIKTARVLPWRSTQLAKVG